MTLQEVQRLDRLASDAANAYVRALTDPRMTPEFVACLKARSDAASREYTIAWGVYQAQVRNK